MSSSPGAIAAERVWDEITSRKGYDQVEIDRDIELEILGEIQAIIEQEYEGLLKEDHHGPKQGGYMERALKNQ